MSDVVRLRVGGVTFDVDRETLLSVKNTYFHGLLSSGAWQPDADGAYFIDRPALGFDRILEYLSSGELSVDGLSEAEEECIYGNLDYFLIPYKRQWKYNTHSLIEGFSVHRLCELKDGRLCGTYKNVIIIWNLDTNAIDMTIEGHTRYISEVIQLQDGRLCTDSSDNTIKLWNLDSGLCELTLTGHTDDVSCMIQLFDGRVCSGSEDGTIRVWNASTGVCEMTVNSKYAHQLSQLDDGRICCGESGDDGARISIYRLLTRECELSWDTNTDEHRAFACIDSNRVCSGSNDHSTIRVWNTATGKCERTLRWYRGRVNCIALRHDGKLCSTATANETIKIWNMETGERETTVRLSTEFIKATLLKVLPLSDGRLVAYSHGGVVILIF